MRPAADADFVICPNASCGQVLVLPSRRLLCPAADSDIEIPINRKKNVQIQMQARYLELNQYASNK